MLTSSSINRPSRRTRSRRAVETRRCCFWLSSRAREEVGPARSSAASLAACRCSTAWTAERVDAMPSSIEPRGDARPKVVTPPVSFHPKKQNSKSSIPMLLIHLPPLHPAKESENCIRKQGSAPPHHGTTTNYQPLSPVLAPFLAFRLVPALFPPSRLASLDRCSYRSHRSFFPPCVPAAPFRLRQSTSTSVPIFRFRP